MDLTMQSDLQHVSIFEDIELVKSLGILGLWCLTSLSTIFIDIVAVSCIGGGNRSTQINADMPKARILDDL
jgi:hypothetical protein